MALETTTATVEYVIITAARGWPVRVGRGIVHGYEQVMQSVSAWLHRDPRYQAHVFSATRKGSPARIMPDLVLA